MSEIDTYLREKAKKKKIEKLLTWREFYLQGQITWDDLQLALKQKEEGIEDRIKIPVVNTYAAIRVNYKIEKLT